MKKDLENDANVDYEAGLEHEDELEVEAYSPHELKSKKRRIVTRVAIAGVILAIVIGVTGLVIKIYYPDSVENVKHKVQTTVDNNWNTNVLGGSGSWFLSRLERVYG